MELGVLFVVRSDKELSFSAQCSMKILLFNSKSDIIYYLKLFLLYPSWDKVSPWSWQDMYILIKKWSSICIPLAFNLGDGVFLLGRVYLNIYWNHSFPYQHKHHGWLQDPRPCTPIRPCCLTLVKFCKW